MWNTKTPTARTSDMGRRDTPQSSPAGRQLLGRPGWVLLLLSAVEFMVIVDFSITTVALEPIQDDLGFSDTGLQWVVNGYGVAIATLLLLGGRAADLFGARRVFVTGLALFTIASLVGGFAPSPSGLVLARAVQGVGAAFLTPAALSLLLATIVEPRARARALGIWGAVGASGVGAGLLIGGAILEVGSWRWVLWVNVPIGIAALTASAVLIPRDNRIRRERAPLDIRGALLVSTGVLLVVYALAQSETTGLFGAATLSLMAGGATLLVGFVRAERHAISPLLPPGFLRRPGLAAANLLSLAANAALAGTFVILSLHLSGVVALEPLATGLALLPMAGALVIASGAVAPLLLIQLGMRATATIGMALNALGLLGLALTLPGADEGWALAVLPASALVGTGYGLAFPAWTATGVDQVPEADQGLAAGILASAQEIGAAVGLALLVAASAATVGESMTTAATTNGHQAALYAAAAIAAVAIPVAMNLPTERS